MSEICRACAGTVDNHSEYCPAQDYQSPTKVSPPISSPEPSSKEIAEHINAFMDELNWFHKRQIKIHLTPKPDGWNLKFSIPDPQK